MDFESYSDSRVKWINDYIEGSLKRYREGISQRFVPLVDSMRYSLEGGGKRLRPLLVLASAECLGLDPKQVLPAACAIEYIHTYSLVHDDLPAIDDDDTRRGKPSNHKKFGEAVAILTGDALLTEAFAQMLSLNDGKFPPQNVMKAIETLVQYSGVRGMVGGQLLDVTTDSTNYSLPEVEFIHIHKTGALILASVMLPTRLMNVDENLAKRLRRFGEAFGLAFQISDDLLDSEAMVRYSRGPRKKPKPTYFNLMSPVEMREKMNGLVEAAIQAVSSEGEKAKPLIGIAEFIRARKR